MKVTYFPHHLLSSLLNKQVLTLLMEVFTDTKVFSNGVLEIVTPSPINNNLFIIVKFLFVLSS